MKKVYIALIFILVLSLIIYGNIAIKSNKSIGYINIILQISNSSSTEMKNNTIYIYSQAGKQATGSISIKNNENKEKYTKISSSGKISKWITIQEDNFELKQGEEKIIKLVMFIPKDITGNYTGKLKIES